MAKKTSHPADQPARDRIHSNLDATLFVEAGAGTGKTRELIERVLRLVATGRAKLRQIAAITFTESAAAELRDRIRIRLEEAAREGSGLPADERERCYSALAELDAAAIETLHGFAYRILSEHPLEAGLPPAIDVQDDVPASIAFDDRWTQFVDELLGDAALEKPLLRAFTMGLDLANLRDVALEFHENWDRLEDASIEQVATAPVDATMVLRKIADVLEQRSHCTDPEDRLLEHLARLEPYYRRLAAAESEMDILRIMAEPAKIASGGGRAENWGRVAPKELREQLAHARDLRDQQISAARQAALSPILEKLRLFILQYAEERQQRGVLEFHDLLVQARDLLRRDTSVRNAVRAKFSHLLIDEFQDTDPLQLDIAVLLAGEETNGAVPAWHEAEIEEGRLFFVGDPKQSIYRFRRADIALYQKAQAHFSQGTVRLSQNFRSLPPVIDWVNHIFDDLMGDGSSGQVAYQALEAALPWKGGAVTARALGGPSDMSLAQVRDREANEIARSILAAKSERWQVAFTDAAGKRETRDARYADIALLLPTRTTLPQIEQALEDAGIPYRVESRSLVYDTQEVRDLLSILRSLDDPTDEVALIAALRSPAFACGDDDLLRYSQAKGSWDYRRDAPDRLDGDDPVVAAMVALRDLHQRRWWEPINGLVEAVIRERRLFELAFAHRRPRERWQRLRFVLDQARAFAEAGGRTLRQFIDWAERQAEEETRVAETVVPEADDDAVRIMTVHAAKGLEFPIVLLAGLNVGPRSQRTSSADVLWGEGGKPEVRIGGDRSRFETSGYQALSDHEKEMDKLEKVRLLYVAATRARDHLVVSLHHSHKQKSHASALYERFMATPEFWRKAEMFVPSALAETAAPVTFDDSAERRDGWREARQQRIAEHSRVRTVSATEIAHSAPGAEDDPNIQKDVPVEEIPPWRRGRAGTALGRAVHAVLQSIDLASGADLESAARAQAAAEGIADRAGEIARMVAAALEAPSLKEALAGGRYWREIYVGAPVDGVTVEGFVDLLYETEDGLVVVDYKTDVMPTEADLDAAVERYRLQGAAYALALEEALGRRVGRCIFVFVRAGGAREREVEDLPAAVAEAREEIARHGV